PGDDHDGGLARRDQGLAAQVKDAPTPGLPRRGRAIDLQVRVQPLLEVAHHSLPELLLEAGDDVLDLWVLPDSSQLFRLAHLGGVLVAEGGGFLELLLRERVVPLVASNKGLVPRGVHLERGIACLEAELAEAGEPVRAPLSRLL